MLQSLEDELSDVTALLDQAQRRLLLPHTLLSFGTAGTYGGLTDLWIEAITCQFVMDVLPASPSSSSSSGPDDAAPRVHVLLCGVSNGQGSGGKEAGGGGGEAGFSVRLLVQGFRLKGDRAPVVPLDLR